MRTLTEAAKAAKLIRQELKKEFPGIKFSVISENYSMGNSVTIYWDKNSGLESEKVRLISDKYQKGSFDMMTDTYEYTNNRKDIPQVTYVLTQRR